MAAPHGAGRGFGVCGLSRHALMPLTAFRKPVRNGPRVALRHRQPPRSAATRAVRQAPLGRLSSDVRSWTERHSPLPDAIQAPLSSSGRLRLCPSQPGSDSRFRCGIPRGPTACTFSSQIRDRTFGKRREISRSTATAAEMLPESGSGGFVTAANAPAVSGPATALRIRPDGAIRRWAIQVDSFNRPGLRFQLVGI